MNKNGHVKAACYSMNIAMSLVGVLPPILFLTFRSMYGLSYSLLGLLILINFGTQLTVDLIFSFFSHRFNITKTVRIMPCLAFFGFLVYALSPVVFPQYPFAGLFLGTVIFSASSGLAEVLLSPIIAALPSDNPEREMSKLHSVYAWGTVGVTVASTLLLRIIGTERWYITVILFSLIPLISALLFAGADVPETKPAEKNSGAVFLLRNSGVWLCVTAIFLGGAAEVTMSQWASGYLEQSLGLPKVWGDICGVALFGAALGLGRTLYSRIGKNIFRVLLLGAVGATVCYLLAAVTPHPAIGLFACALTGFCVSMMWPGSLVVASDRFPDGGVVIFAMMAAGGDLGAALVPQLVGTLTDAAMKNPAVLSLASRLAMSGEQLGMRLGLLAGMLFPLAAIFVFSALSRRK